MYISLQYDEGLHIELGVIWYSLTPESIANHVAEVNYARIYGVDENDILFFHLDLVDVLRSYHRF